MRKTRCPACGGPATEEAVPQFGSLVTLCDDDACSEMAEEPLVVYDED